MHRKGKAAEETTWPALPFDAWRPTCETLHLWLQIVGKIALARLPWLNHSWHVALRVSPRGLATRLMPCAEVAFGIELDFIGHLVHIQATDGRFASLPLEPQSTATFYRRLMDTLAEIGLPVSIRTMPCELPDAIPFDQDETHGSYDREYANRFWRVLVQASRPFEEFRSRFIGKSSPVHFFWGSADLAVTRFSGRRAPTHPGGIPNLSDEVVRDAYSHEVSSCGFWPGNAAYPHAAFYSYAYPEPPGFAAARVLPRAASYSESLKEFILPYDEVRNSASPDATLLEFLQSTYEAAAIGGRWDRAALESRQSPAVQKR